MCSIGYGPCAYGTRWFTIKIEDGILARYDPTDMNQLSLNQSINQSAEIDMVVLV
jgi:hypothetical protein